MALSKLSGTKLHTVFFTGKGNEIGKDVFLNRRLNIVHEILSYLTAPNNYSL